VDAAPVDDHHHFLPGFPEGCHHLMDILAQLLRIKMGDDLIEDFGGPILDCPNDTEQHTAGDTAPGAILHPRLPFEGLRAFNLTLAQGAYGEASPPGCTPPARTGQRKAPQDRFIFIEQNDLTPTGLIFESREVDRGIREGSGVRIQAPGGAVVAYVFFLTRCGHSHGSAGLRSRGRRRSRVRGSSIGKRPRRAGGGLGQRGD
jgi:hypothetical protein